MRKNWDGRTEGEFLGGIYEAVAGMNPKEHDEQAALVKWCEYRRIGLFSVPNGFIAGGQVLSWRYGLDDGIERSFGEIGDKTGLSEESVRRIEAKTLRQLRHPSHTKILKEHLI